MKSILLGFLFNLAFVSPAVLGQTTQGPTTITPKAQQIHNSAIVVDTHADTPQRFLDGGFDIGNSDPADKGHISLEKATVTVTAPAAPELRHRLLYQEHQSSPMSTLNGFELRLRNDAGTSNPALLTFADAPLVIDNGDNDTPDKAQAVPVPCTISGRVEKRRDRSGLIAQAPARRQQVFQKGPRARGKI